MAIVNSHRQECRHEKQEFAPPRRPTLHGWASDNYALSEDPPAVLINPEADALTLLSWGFGQLQQCNAVLDALSAAGQAMPETSAQGVGAVLHFSAQAEQVLKVGIERLRHRGHALGD